MCSSSNEGLQPYSDQCLCSFKRDKIERMIDGLAMLTLIGLAACENLSISPHSRVAGSRCLGV